MYQMNNGSTTRKAFSSPKEDEILESLIRKQVTGQLDNGGRFYGALGDFDDRSLYIIGDRNQPIIIRRKSIARLEVV